MKPKRIIVGVCVAIAVTFVARVATTFRERYVQEQSLVSADLISKGNSAYLMVQTQQEMYRLSGWTQWKNWFFGWPIWDERYARQSLHLIEITQGGNVTKHTYVDFVAPGMLIPFDGRIYVRDRPTRYEDAIAMQNSPDPFKYYGWEDGEFVAANKQKENELAEQVRGPLEDHYAVEGWNYIEHSEHQDAADANTPIELQLDGRNVSIKFDKTPQARRTDRWFGVRIEINEKLALIETFPDKVIDRHVTVDDWRAFIDAGAHKTW